MSNYDLIAFDMDGTLLDSQKKIRKDSLDAIKKAAQAGKIVALSTGRCVPELWKYMDDLSNVQYVIGVSGALVFTTKNKHEIYTHTISPDVVFQILEQVKNVDLMVHMLSQDSIIQKDKVSHMSDYNMGIYQPMFEKITVKPEDLYDFYRKNPIPLYKLNLYFRNISERDMIREKLSALPITLVYAETASLECSAQNVSKGQGLIRLCKHLGIPVSRTIAVGDADNDLEILKTAGLAIAMGNANAHVLDLADVVVNDNDHGGCAEAIIKYLLATDSNKIFKT